MPARLAARAARRFASWSPFAGVGLMIGAMSRGFKQMGRSPLPCPVTEPLIRLATGRQDSLDRLADEEENRLFHSVRQA